jgi:EAL domain-containing protein (putative c-di-GMP-specific phosphodiesterase class I)/GGDEF domain-containing protein
MTSQAITGFDSITIEQFHQCLQSELPHADSSHVLALLVVSLRRSDRIASLLHHEASIQATGELVARIRTVMRDADRLVLVNHDECWLLLPQLRTEAMAQLAVHRLLAVLHPPFMHGNHAMFLRPCIGIACAPHHAQSASALLHAADLAQQAARSSNAVYATSEADGDKGILPDDLESALNRVLAGNELTVAYQPKIDLGTGRPASIEALVRWPENDSHPVPTLSLVETAERCGLIEAVTMHVVNTVLRERKTWMQHGIDTRVWINLSARLLTQKQLPQMLKQALQVWHVPPSAIGFEITESALIHDIEQTTEILFELKQIGFSLTIDDFGTGYSSLAYLRRFPISELKIDRIFVQGMTHSEPDYQIVKSIIELAHNFELTVVAEGAEEEATIVELKKLECDMAQGFVYAKPMPIQSLVAWWTAFGRES